MHQFVVTVFKVVAERYLVSAPHEGAAKDMVADGEANLLDRLDCQTLDDKYWAVTPAHADDDLLENTFVPEGFLDDWDAS